MMKMRGVDWCDETDMIIQGVLAGTIMHLFFIRWSFYWLFTFAKL